MHRALSLIAARAAAALILAAAASAHDYVPGILRLRPGGEDFVYCADQGTCPADITLSSLDPGAIEVHALDMITFNVLPGNGLTYTAPSKVVQVFRVRAKTNATAPLNAAVRLCWTATGPDAQGNPCNDDNCPGGVVIPVEIVADPITAGAATYSGVARDPVDTATGELFEPQAPDLDLGGPMPLVFSRYYASRLASEGNATSTLGPNWTHDFAWRLLQTGWNVEIYTDRGRVIRFEKGFNAASWAPALYETVPYQLVQVALDWKLVDPTDNSIRTFDAAGRLTKVEDGRGNAHTVTYAGSLVASVADGLGRVLTFTHTAGKLTRVSDGTRHVDYTYDAQGRLATYADAAAKVTTYAYDAAFPTDALLTSKTLPEGNTPYSQTWDAQKRVATQTDAAGHTFTFAYGTSTTVGDPLGETTVFVHDAGAALTSLEDEAGEVASLANDAKGRRKSVDDRLGGTTSWTRHAASGRLSSMTEADGSTTTYSWTKRSAAGLDFYDLASIDRPNGASESFAHDASGNLTQAVDASGEAWSYAYNARGQLLTATDPTGAVTTLAYNADGTLASVTDGATRTTTFGYDALRRATLITRADAATVQFAYDALDRVTGVTDELARTTTLAYDDNGNLESITNHDGETTTFAYDGLDRPVGAQDAEGNAVAAAYDELGHVAALTNGEGEATALGYDVRGRLASITGSGGDTWTLATDHEALPTGAADPLANAMSVTRDSRGRPTAVASPLGNVTRLAWDSLGRLSRVTDAKGKVTKLARNGNGELTSLELPIANGKVTATRDEAGRITEMAYPGAREWSYGYDAAGRPSSRTDPLGNTTSASWDVRNRPQTITLPGGLGTVTATWNDAGQLTDLAGSDGAGAHYAYDAAGRLVDGDGVAFAYDDAGRVVDSDGIAIAYDDAHRPISKTLAPGKVVTYAYDAAGRLDTVSDWLGGVTTFTWDAADRVTEILRPNGVATRYTYDADSRVTLIEEVATVPSPSGEVPIAVSAISHDELNRVDALDVTGLLNTLPSIGQSARSFNAGGQLNGSTHDARGLLIIDGVRTNTWNTFGQLASTDDGSTTTTFEYNGLGDVSAIEVLSGDRLELARDYSAYGSAAMGGAISVVTKNAADETYYVRTPAGEPLYSVDAATDAREFFHFDYRGSTHFRTDDSATVTVHYSYSPYGEVIGQSGASLDEFTLGARFGAYTPRGGDFSFFGSRPYSPTLGLFWKPDHQRPFDARAGNPYAFDATPRSSFTKPLDYKFSTVIDVASSVFDFTGARARAPSTPTGFAWDPGRQDTTVLRGGGGIYYDAKLASTTLATLATLATSPEYGGGFSPITLESSGLQQAHGYAFVSDIGAQKLAQGYLALILDADRPFESGVLTPRGSYREVVDKLRERFRTRQRVRHLVAAWRVDLRLGGASSGGRGPVETTNAVWNACHGDFGTFAAVFGGLDVPEQSRGLPQSTYALAPGVRLVGSWLTQQSQDDAALETAMRISFGF